MPRSKSSAPARSRNGWRFWVVEPLLWIAGLVALIMATGLAVVLVIRLPFGQEIAAALAYTVWMIMMIFLPGRSNPGYNPFGAIVRRVYGPLLRLHAFALLIVMPAVWLALYLRARFAPRWLYGVCVAFGICLTFWEGFRASDLLQTSEYPMRKRKVSTPNGA